MELYLEIPLYLNGLVLEHGDTFTFKKCLKSGCDPSSQMSVSYYSGLEFTISERTLVVLRSPCVQREF